MLLNNKVAIITGGTRGIGFSTVVRFLDEGARIALFGSRQESVDKALKNLEKIRPMADVMGLCPDLNDPLAISEAIDTVCLELGKLDILVNNAGISASESLFDYDAKDFKKITDLNINAVFYGSQAAAKVMAKKGGGVILNTSSVVSLYAQPSGCGYPTSKFAINGLTKSLARELGKDGIRVNAVAPGVIGTDMVAALPEEVVQGLCASIPLGRMGKPEDIANAFVFLASDMASYITGAVLSVDGAIVI
ncbi:MAG: SDR family oxidoreductase [Clostridiales Family XIII bacterium]|jgi:3-oxoacyl-[acyl-carrier protein] reductase/7-alpha-hydroxysteroid dehydrogenase|nr:SDR family oxidoreductase [Clostridiales Family XIII bacterium]